MEIDALRDIFEFMSIANWCGNIQLREENFQENFCVPAARGIINFSRIDHKHRREPDRQTSSALLGRELTDLLNHARRDARSLSLVFSATSNGFQINFALYTFWILVGSLAASQRAISLIFTHRENFLINDCLLIVFHLLRFDFSTVWKFHSVSL